MEKGTYKKNYYISGPITRLIKKNKDYKKAFAQAEAFLRENAWYLEIFNPVVLSERLETIHGKDNLTYQDYMIKDIECLLLCDCIYMLRGWQFSKGARFERKIAKFCGIKVIYQKRGQK